MTSISCPGWIFNDRWVSYRFFSTCGFRFGELFTWCSKLSITWLGKLISLIRPMGNDLWLTIRTRRKKHFATFRTIFLGCSELLQWSRSLKFYWRRWLCGTSSFSPCHPCYTRSDTENLWIWSMFCSSTVNWTFGSYELSLSSLIDVRWSSTNVSQKSGIKFKSFRALSTKSSMKPASSQWWAHEHAKVLFNKTSLGRRSNWLDLCRCRVHAIL